MFESFRSVKKSIIPDAEHALPGREEPVKVSPTHCVNGHSVMPPFPEGFETVLFGMGCFWGAERRFWQIPGVYVTSAGYAGGSTVNPTYEETCSGQTGHTEIVQVVFDPEKVTLAELLKTFWEAHDPTQVMRQGNDIGTQYRSAIYVTSEAQRQVVERSRESYQEALSAKGLGEIATEVKLNMPFYYAEDYHQQYLHKNPGGYCGLKGTGVTCSLQT